MPTPLREAAFEAIAAQLTAALPDVAVERNRRDPPDLDRETLPRLAFMDGDHQVQGSDAVGTVLYRVQAMVEGHVTAASNAAVNAAINDLHARVVAAICNREIPVDGDQDVWPLEEAMQLVPFASEDSSTRFMGFVLTIGFDLRVPDASGPYATI